MAKAKRVLRCFKCGAVLQTNKKTEKGYIPKEMLKTTSPENAPLYCNKCFEDMKAINIGKLNYNVDSDILKVLDDAVATDALIIWVVDLFSFNGIINPDIARKVKPLNVAVVATHRDLFPKAIKEASFVEYINSAFEEHGITPKEVVFFGVGGKIDTEGLVKRLHEIRRGHDVYMIGSLMSGKTTVINNMLKNYSNKTQWVIKTENYPGTRAKVMTVPLSRSSFFYELPSLSLSTSILSKIEKDIQKMVTPKKNIKISQRTLSDKETIVIGNLAAIVLKKGKSTLFKLYSSEMVESRKIETEELDDFLIENYRRRTVRPVSDRLESFKDYDLFEYEMENDNELHDIAIEGLGWVSFIAKGQTIHVLLPKGTALKESLSKIK